MKTLNQIYEEIAANSMGSGSGIATFDPPLMKNPIRRKKIKLK